MFDTAAEALTATYKYRRQRKIIVYACQIRGRSNQLVIMWKFPHVDPFHLTINGVPKFFEKGKISPIP